MLFVSLFRKHLKMKTNKLTANKLLQILNSISNTPCKTGENKTAAVFVYCKRKIIVSTRLCLKSLPHLLPLM